jgi:hypothetical protein
MSTITSPRSASIDASRIGAASAALVTDKDGATVSIRADIATSLSKGAKLGNAAVTYDRGSSDRITDLG